MKQQKRKGFTLVELLVVIAILAILATVSIVGYTSFVKKAQISNDTALAKQINDLLLADETVDGKPGTLGGALAVVSENGFDVTKLTPTAQGHEFVYDIVNNRFALLDVKNNNKVVYSAANLSDKLEDRWVIRADNEAARPEGYSVYFTKPIATLKLEKLIGVEGEITSLTITDSTPASEDPSVPVVIAGNIDKIEITAPNGVVHHYDSIRRLVIKDIKTDSWHEFGTVGVVDIKQGHLVVESTANVNTIFASSKSTAHITVQPGAKYETIAKHSKATAVIDGVPENEIFANVSSVSSSFAGGLGTEERPYIVTNAKQFDKAVNLTAANWSFPIRAPYYKLSNDISIDTDQIITKCVLDLNGHTLSVNGGLNVHHKSADVTIKNGSVEVGGNGIWVDHRGNPDKGAKITVENVNLTTSGEYAIYMPAGHVTAVIKGSTINGGTYGIGSMKDNNSVTIEDCEILNTIECGVYQAGSGAPNNITIKNTTISSEHSVGVYISNSANAARQTLTMENCSVTGVTAVEVKHTDATITGCTLIATSQTTTATEYDNGSCTTGYAFAASSNGADENVTGTVILTDCKLYTGSAAGEQNGKTFVFQLADGASVTINGTAVTKFGTYN